MSKYMKFLSVVAIAAAYVQWHKKFSSIFLDVNTTIDANPLLFALGRFGTQKVCQVFESMYNVCAFNQYCNSELEVTYLNWL